MILKRLSEIHLPVYWKMHLPSFKCSRRYLRGGRYSGKSTEVARSHIEGMLKDVTKTKSCIAFRKFGNTLQGSVFNEYVNAIYDLGVENEFEMVYSPLQIRRKNSHQVIMFSMLNQPDDFRKIKSIKLVKSYFAYIWFEEADEFTDPKAIRQVLLSLFRNGNEFEVTYTFNTPFSPEHPLNVEWGTRDKYHYQHTTVYDLPKNIIPAEIWEEIEDMKKYRPKEYEHTILGKPGDPDAIIYPNVSRYTYDPDYVKAFDLILRGIDFGFAPDPTAYIDMYYDSTHRDLYILNEVYEQRLTSPEIAERVRQKWHSYGPITCEIDKRVIEELNNAGLYCLEAKKGPNSRELGTKWLQELNHIYIDPARTPNAWREFTTAEYARDKYGNVTTKIPDGNDHLRDAARYATEDYWNTSQLTVGDRRLF